MHVFLQLVIPYVTYISRCSLAHHQRSNPIYIRGLQFKSVCQATLQVTYA